MTKIFAGGIPKSFTQQDFAAYFAKFGAVNEASLIHRQGVSRCFGFVKYVDPEIAENVVGQIHRLKGKVITVKFSDPSKFTSNFTKEFPKRFWIGSINESVISKHDLIEYFSAFGFVDNTFIVKGRGFGFVTIIFNNPNNVQMIQKHRKHPIKGEEVEVKAALPKKTEAKNFRPDQRFDREFQVPKSSMTNFPKQNSIYYQPGPAIGSQWSDFKSYQNPPPQHHSFPLPKPAPLHYPILKTPQATMMPKAVPVILKPAPLISKPVSSFTPQITAFPPQSSQNNPITRAQSLHEPSPFEDSSSSMQRKKKRPPYRSVGKYESFGADPAPCTYEIPSPSVEPVKVPNLKPKADAKFQYTIRTPLKQLGKLGTQHFIHKGMHFAHTQHPSPNYSRSFHPY